ncbi:hypothetical protein AcW1_005634 [Taiwanofungus camphoratus]|nr:hypothetical protein AcV5_005961 [Antrodia cinnamomea]KAI0948251.1 hypothetical protein AcV7_009056 [Antrodia cinnamomea]KAI0957151.1 hypothetical protein AcW1_005634 [Antrodia cinnamomea]
MSIPQSQKVWHVVDKGEPSQVLRLVDDAPVPKLTKDDVLVKVQAAALNPVGYKLINTVPNFILKKPYVPESDLAGVVVDGNGTMFKKDDQVFGWLPVPLVLKHRHGVLAEYTRVPASHLIHRPPNVTPVQAAGITLVGMTAYQALFHVAKLEPEQHLFVNGGSTAVGAFAIQLAKAIGCKVTASASGKNEEYVCSLGADEFIDYTKGLLYEALVASAPTPKYHVILEAVGILDPALFVHSESYLAPGGTFVSVGPQPKGFDVMGLCRFLWMVMLRPTWLGGTKRRWKMVVADHNPEDLQQLTRFVAEGKVKPQVDSVFTFDNTLKAYDKLMTGRATVA